MDENKKVVVNLPEGTTQAEITVREGAASRVLDPKAPVKIDLSGVIGAPVEFWNYGGTIPNKLTRCAATS